jgi:L-fucose/D-arabinose isomerase
MKIKPPRILNKSMPKIGIRPTVDGRRKGVRESLENQTMELAKSVAKLIESNLKHSNGLKMECVISDTCIGGVAESIKSEEKFTKESVGATITVTPSWCYGLETMDMNAYIPKAIWGLNGTERPGAVYLAAALAAYNQKGIPAFGVYGREIQDKDDCSIPSDVKEKILKFAKASISAAFLKGNSYLSIGGISMGIASSIVDHGFLENYLGMIVEYVDMSELVRRVDEEIYDKEEFKKAIKWIKKYCIEGKDNNPVKIQKTREQKDRDWEFVVKMAIIVKDLMIGNPKLERLGFIEESLGHNAIAAGFQGQRNWTDHFPNGDFMETILNSSFDWDGIREPYIVATENDFLNGISMLFAHLLSNVAQIFVDVRTFWSPDSVKRVTGYSLKGIAENGIIHLLNSGSAAIDGTGIQINDGKPALKPYWEITEEEVFKSLNEVLFRPALLEYFRGGGFSLDYLTSGNMPVTISRINIINRIGPVLQIAEGYTVVLPKGVHNILDERTDPTWPTTWFAPILTGKGSFEDVYSVMNNWGANHAVVSYGHIGADLITLASILRIPVPMHNIARERIFRPSAWSAFGTNNLEGADFEACKNFGPLYKK